MKKSFSFILLLAIVLVGKAQEQLQSKVSNESMLNRFLSYVKIESQSIDEPSMTSFPLTEGQRKIARYIYDEVRAFNGKGVKVTISDDHYVYIDIPSNIKGDVPSVLFMAHLDVTPEAPGDGIRPIVHRNYDGRDISLPGGITLSPNALQGAHLRDLVGKTIVTSDGTTLLGADDKTGCAILVSLTEELIKNPDFKHGRVMIALTQNEDVGKAALRYDPSVFGDKPDYVVDIDGSLPDTYKVANFTAVGHTYYFKGNLAHPSDGKKNGYADALTAASYFIGQIPPEIHPSAREGKEGYVHCYSMFHPVDENNKPIESDYVVKVRLRYFDQEEGAFQKQLLAENLEKVKQAFPHVEVMKTDDILQYENIAYTMPQDLSDMVHKAAKEVGMPMTPNSGRGGTTSAMMVAAFPDAMPGGISIYSGQQSAHSPYEWCCIEELISLVDLAENLISQIASKK